LTEILESADLVSLDRVAPLRYPGVPDLLSLESVKVLRYPSGSFTHRTELRPVSEWGISAHPQKPVLHHVQLAPIRVTSPPAAAPWVAHLISNINRMSVLPGGWDGYDGLPLSFDAAVEALRFLASVMKPTTEPPWIVPLSNGGLQVEWHDRGLDIEIAFGEREEPVCLISEGDDVAEIALDEAATRLPGLLETLPKA
jgi:hypothetical protein